MTENSESAAQQYENTPEPTVEREVGQYSGGDYGEGGTVGDQTGPESGGYSEGDYGEGGTEHPSGGGDGVLDAEDIIPGPADDNTEGTGRKA